MQESFIQLVWQLGYFDKTNWRTASGEPVEVYKPGRLNLDAGPDFKGARLKIADLQWHGDVELHLKASGWQQHRHQLDEAYNKVVLHVVLEDDNSPALRQDGSTVPVVSLAGRIPADLHQRYQQLMDSLAAIPCQSQIQEVNSFTRLSMLDRSLMQRLQRKAEGVLQLFELNNHDWEETAWQVLAKSFGFKKNGEALESLSQRLPYKILLRHAASPLQQEALLYGMSGLLAIAETHPEVERLQREWKLLAHKWSLQDKVMHPSQWLFARLRPANFPTLRIAQLAALIQRQPKIFSLLLHSKAKDLLKELQVGPSAYWKKHYHFGRESKEATHALGRGSAENLLINVVAPLRVAYGRYTQQQNYVDDAVELLQALGGEDNKIMRYWKKMDMPVASAADTQGLLELYNEYCAPKRCLSCSIGLSILKQDGLS